MPFSIAEVLIELLPSQTSLNWSIYHTISQSTPVCTRYPLGLSTSDTIIAMILCRAVVLAESFVPWLVMFWPTRDTGLCLTMWADRRLPALVPRSTSHHLEPDVSGGGMACSSCEY
jgi:hypothetical protein